MPGRGIWGLNMPDTIPILLRLADNEPRAAGGIDDGCDKCREGYVQPLRALDRPNNYFSRACFTSDGSEQAARLRWRWGVLSCLQDSLVGC